MMPKDPTQSTVIFPLIKIVLAGDEGVGKTSLIHRYCSGVFDPDRGATQVPDFQIKIVDVDGKPIRLAIWDVAGQEQLGALRESLYRGARAVALVYDLTNEASLQNLPRWHTQIGRVCPTAGFVVVGNKLDLKRATLPDQVKVWAESMGLLYTETSALADRNVNELFQTLARLATKKSK